MAGCPPVANPSHSGFLSPFRSAPFRTRAVGAGCRLARPFVMQPGNDRVRERYRAVRSWRGLHDPRSNGSSRNQQAQQRKKRVRAASDLSSARGASRGADQMERPVTQGRREAFDDPRPIGHFQRHEPDALLRVEELDDSLEARTWAAARVVCEQEVRHRTDHLVSRFDFSQRSL